MACSIDGFISGVDDDISGFVPGGDGIDKYLSDLNDFETVIMGKNTYEFGYKYGLVPGQPAYAHMNHFIFSTSLKFENPHEKINVMELSLNQIEKIRKESTTDIYMCGGGELAGWLLDNEKIDILKIKLNPLILGDGVRLFGASKKKCILELMDSEKYEGGLQIMTYKVLY